MKNLNHIGISNEYLPVDLFNILKEQINNFKGRSGYQEKLAGNIKEEWNMSEVIPLFNTYILNLINKNKTNIEYLNLEKKKFFDKIPMLQLINFWVNFQKKHEFNPVHNHNGLFSFVIFVQIPYDINQELKQGPGHLSNSNFASCLQFQVTNTIGRHHNETIYVDKSYEGGIYFFNAETKHCVYPFFTSDESRITVSGNIGWVC
jgi:hypothetical protein